jgi:hypothetical protein
VKAVPDAGNASTGAADLSSAWIEAQLGIFVPSQPKDSSVVLAEVPTPTRSGVCGNSVCELGERTADGVEGSCPADCGIASRECAEGCESGLCLSANGICECFKG